MAIYGHHPMHYGHVPCEANLCDSHGLLHSTLGKGPRGHGVSVEVIDGDPYGYYRLGFKDSVTGQMLAVTPNLDPGSRIYVCDRDFTAQYEDSYSANISDFTTEQLGSIRDVRVGDIVMFKAHENEIYMIGIGVVNSITGDVVRFTSHINLSAGNIKESLDEYIDRYVNQKVSELTASIDVYLSENVETAVIQLEDFKNQILNFAKSVYFGINQEGYFVAYIPESWNDIVFDTGTDYHLDTYGRLILRMIVDGSSNIDQTPEVVRPYSESELERIVYNIVNTLYSTNG